MYPIYILSGGLATRLGDISKKTPKCLLEINGKPFLHYQLKSLIKNNINDVTLCLGHLGDMVVKYVKNSEFRDHNISFCFDGKKRLGTGGAIKQAVQLESTPFFVMYGDSYLDISFKDVYDNFDDKNGPLMTIFKNNNQYDVSNVSLEGKNLKYSKTLNLDNAEYIDYGLSIFSKEHFKNFEGTFDLSALQEYYSFKNKMQWYIAKKRFYEIGSVKGLEEIKNIL
tara:strand:- start:334 stop:1008 length:675 start_codon:yes stop_codon:yes gene_type:complete